MHIPDGFLSPATSLTFYAIATPFLLKASREVSRNLDRKRIPLISLFAALSFIIMMFNIPLPGGTTGHAVGAAITAIILGPWTAILSVTVALIIQALFFGDGGILTLGANIFNMAIIISLSSYTIYRFLNFWSEESLKKRVIFSAIAGYIGINLAALLTGIELGLQPLLFHNSQGQSLYFPYDLKTSIPAMMIGHLTLAGIAEATVTGLVLSWIYKTNPEFISEKRKIKVNNHMFFKRSLVLTLSFILLTPLGILAPGTAWGEWSRTQLQNLGLGYIPQGFDKWNGLWKAPLSGYNLQILKNQTAGYVVSGLTGVILTILLIWGIFWIAGKLTGFNKSRISKPGV